MRPYIFGAILLIALGGCQGNPKMDIMDGIFEEPDSSEHGQYKGSKSTNCTCGWTNKGRGRIVGGKDAEVNEYPHMVGLVRILSRGRLDWYCGASIISQRHCLTAAHCVVDETTALGIVAGEHNIQMKYETEHTKLYEVERWIAHHSYDPRTFENDIALLLIKEPIVFSQAVGRVCLPHKPMNADLVGEYVKVSGWGDLAFQGSAPDSLKKVTLKVVPLDKCAPEYKAHKIQTRFPTQFCTFRFRKDSCQGDSGGPVTWLDPATNRYTLVGVVSFGKGCASDAPGVNTDVYAFIDWIAARIRMTRPYGETVDTCSRTD